MTTAPEPARATDLFGKPLHTVVDGQLVPQRTAPVPNTCPDASTQQVDERNQSDVDGTTAADQAAEVQRLIKLCHSLRRTDNCPGRCVRFSGLQRGGSNIL